MITNRTYYSILWVIGAILAFSLTAIAGKEAMHPSNVNAVGISQLVFFRNVIGLVLVMMFVFRSYFRQGLTLNDGLFKFHLGRNVSHFIGQWCWFYGLSLLTLAQVFAIEFTVPIWTAIFASLLLSEKITKYRVLAIVLGFIGVLVILRPGFVIILDAAWVVLLSAIAYALSHTLTKRLTSEVSVLSILFFMHIIQLPLALALVLFDFAWPQGIAWVYISCTAIAAIAAHYCMAKALSYGDAMLVMPMDFLRLPLIGVLGVLLYNEAVDVWLLVGAGIMLLGNMLALKKEAVHG